MGALRRKRRELRAYRALRGIAADHRAEGHDVEFTAVNEARLVLRCHTCSPDRQTDGGRPGWVLSTPERADRRGRGGRT